MEIFPLKMEICSWSKSEEDEDRLEMMKIYSWGKNDDDLKKQKKTLDFEWELLWLEVDADCWISPCLIPIKRLFQLAMNFFIEMNWKYLSNALSLGYIPCLDWTWVHLILWPLGNMKEDHSLRSLVPAK